MIITDLPQEILDEIGEIFARHAERIAIVDLLPPTLSTTPLLYH